VLRGSRDLVRVASMRMLTALPPTAYDALPYTTSTIVRVLRRLGHVVSAVSPEAYVLIGLGPLHCMLSMDIYRRTRLHRSSHGIFIRDRGGGLDGERHSKGKWVLWLYESGPI
jgi:hypothetical protein